MGSIGFHAPINCWFCANIWNQYVINYTGQMFAFSKDQSLRYNTSRNFSKWSNQFMINLNYLDVISDNNYITDISYT